jgi:hypothetical protein
MCALCLGDPVAGLPLLKEAWQWVDLLARRPVASQEDFSAECESEFEPVGPVGKPADMAEGDFMEEDLADLPGEPWRISSKGNLFSHQKGFHLVIYPVRGGFGLRIEGQAGDFVYPQAKQAILSGMAGVSELLYRGVVPQKRPPVRNSRFKSHGGEDEIPVEVQTEIPFR